ncbi:endonuclease toxin domain-containing protein [Asaia bogorensis]|uniref:endonuclease toxin domain-containing protein n=1 Tax=Asaia bogorensis TaxID=91915 RepID=UPI00301A45BA
MSDQLAALQAKSVSLDLNRPGQSAQGVTPNIPSSTRLGNNSGEVASGAGNAASDLLSLSNKTLSQPTDPSTGLPKLQFLSDTTAIKMPAVVADEKTAFVAATPSATSVVEPKTVTGAAGQVSSSSPPETVQDRTSSGIIQDSQINTITVDTKSSNVNMAAAQSSMVLRSNAIVLSSYEDTPALSYNVSGLVIVNGVTTGWSNQLTLSDNFNRAYPGIAVNTVYDDIGNRRDPAWLQPPMRAYATSDSGSRADTVQTWFKDNADTIGYNVIGTPIPYERYVALRDWLHGEIKQNHMGNQETASNVLHMLATQDNQTTTQLNNIWHLVLGIAITSAALTDAITKISVGHATLSTERQDLAHSSQAAALYAQKYQDVHGHPPSDADIRFAQDKIGNGVSLQQYIWDEAHNGQTSQEYGDVYRQVHGRDPRPVDIEFAQQKIGNGASLQQYRWDEAHNDQTPQEYGDVYRQIHGRDPRPVDIEFAQQKIGNGASLQQYRWDEIHSESAVQDLRAMFRNVAGKEAGDGDVRWLQDAEANGSNFISLRQNLAWSDWGHNAAVSAYRDAVNITPDDAAIRSWQGNLADGGTYTSMRQTIVNYHGADAVRQAYRDSVNIVVDDATVESWKANLVGGGSYQAMRKAIVDVHGHDAVQAVYARTAGIQSPEQFQYDCYQGALANGASIADITRSIAYAWEGKNAVQAVYARTAGIQNPEQFQYDCYQGALANGASIADITRSIAYAWEGKQAIDRLYGDVMGRAVDPSGMQTNQAQLANNQSLTDLRYAIAHSAAEADSLRNAGIFLFGASQTITTSAWLATQQDAIGSGQATYESTLVSAQLAPAGVQTLQSVYQDWGQGLPTDVQLKTMATAMYHLNIAWNRVQYQSADQLAAEAATYHAIDGTASYSRMVENVSYSADQATALLASALTTPMMNEATSAAEFRRVISMGGALLFETVIDQMDVLNNIDTIQKQKEPDPCDPVIFKPAHAILGENGSLTVSNSEIGAANAVPGRQMAGVSTAQWSNGVQWTSQGNGIKAQGNPFEVWDAQRLKKEGFEWLADYRSERNNWKAFDEWNDDAKTAVSDKTMDLNGKTYQNMTRLQGRILANVEAMRRYDTDGGPYRYSGDTKSGTSLEFEKADIKNYVLDLGVPAEPSDDQWRAICQALKTAKARVAADPETSAKTIDFRIADIA